MTTVRKRLGELLVDWGLITHQQLAEVLELQAQEKRRLGVLLIERGYLSATKLTQLLSHQFSLPFVGLARVQYTPELVAMLPAELARTARVVPICTSGDDVLFVATDDPTDPSLVDRVATSCRREVRLMVASPDEVQSVLDAHYSHAPTRPPQPARSSSATTEPTGAVRAAVTQTPEPRDTDPGIHEPLPPLATISIEATPRPEPVTESTPAHEATAAAPRANSAPVVLAIHPDADFRDLCSEAAQRQGLRLEVASLIAASRMAFELKPIAVVIQEKSFAFDRIAFTKISIQAGAHLIIWNDELDARYLEALFATARQGPTGAREPD